MEKFSERLKELREDSNISMKQLAQAIDVSDASVCKWENGLAEPKLSYLIKLAEYFDCSIDFLTGKDDEYTASASFPEETFHQTLSKHEMLILDSFRRIDPKLQRLLFETMLVWEEFDCEKNSDKKG